ncbi:hypothetical protein BEWA_005000 [Theileria equi strain WA]|uniref:Mechanosensitive ion channel MscS domain-containing protein n=1 Tax=Theileria equi strain WA TaxID=1537102 RepID=L0AZR5_THEEQ|nr:hypothetical protein BEWA_005000 [Theileria equi strain WA]AFZ81092.1 hypothetical protein BEWA_005000 [Theileria equi strain WA]|eukprot:XP_004830758.1 hypothetical protein BEWA_005000 [Theileria equi strain WA]
MATRRSTTFRKLLSRKSTVNNANVTKDSQVPPKVDIPINQHITIPEYGDDDSVVESNIWVNLEAIFLDYFPDKTPIKFVILHTFGFFIFLSFRSLSFPIFKDDNDPEKRAIIQVIEDLAFVDVNNNPDDLQLRLTTNTVLFLLSSLSVNILSLVVIMFLRFIFVRCIFEPFSKISRYVVLLAHSIDPAIFYFLWSIINYTTFKRYTLPAQYGDYFVVYKSFLYGEAISNVVWIDGKCYSWSNLLYHLHILLSIRKLILSAILFFFELQFLSNYSSDLVTFLKQQASLKAFNVQWLQYLDSLRNSEKNRELTVLIDTHSNTEIPSNIRKNYNTIPTGHTRGDFKVFKPIIAKWKHHNIHSNINVNDYIGTYFLRDNWTESSIHNTTINWIVLNYVIHNPPEILLINYSIQLICKDTIDFCSKLLFDQIHDTLLCASGEKLVSSSLDRESVENTAELPDHKPRVRFSDRTTIRNPDVNEKDSIVLLSGNRNSCNDNKDNEDDRSITKKICSPLGSAVTNPFFEQFDIANCGYITPQNFLTGIINMCAIRKRLITTLKNQRSILELVGNLISIILWFMCFVALLLSLKINKNIVLPSTIGLFSATIVALSYLYTSFITAILFVVISNPYNVGDRVKVGDQAMYVKSISTYNTEFTSSHGKCFIYQNIFLSKMMIVNEARGPHAVHEINLKISPSTTPASLKILKDNVKTFVNSRPRDFVTDGCLFYGSDLQINHFYHLKILVTCVESWAQTRFVFMLKNEVVRFVANQCKLLGITYRDPVLPVSFRNPLAISGMH